MAALVAVLVPATVSAADFHAFLASYRAAAPAERAALVSSFVESRSSASQGFPIVEPAGEVLFFYAGSGGEESVRLVGDFLPKGFNNVYWDPDGEAMTRAAPGGGLFFARRRFESDARLDYAFVVDGERVADPLNPRRIVSGVGGGEVSELVMPEHVLAPEATARPGVAKGTLEVVAEPWASPRVMVYLPPGYDPAARYPVVYTADGSAWIELVRLPTILDNLIAEGAIEPVVVVLVDAAEDRSAWYDYDPELLAYLERVAAYVDDRYATRPTAAQRVHAGTSAGGRASLFVALERPDLFGKVAMLSPSTYGPVSYWGPVFSGERPLPEGLEVWMSAGTYEDVVRRDVEALGELFERHGVPVATAVTHEGHSFGTWRNAAPRMLRHFFGARPSEPTERGDDYRSSAPNAGPAR